MVRQALIALWRALSAGPARARTVFSPWTASRRRERSRFPLWCVGRSSFAVVEGLLTDVGLGVLGWGFGEYESALLNGPRTAGRPYRARRSCL